MKTTSALSLAVTIALIVWAAPAGLGQAVHVSADRGGVTLSVAAQKPYVLSVSGQAKTPVLSIGCQQKGHKFSHTISISPGSILKEQQYSGYGKSASLVLEVTVSGQKLSTNWISYDNFDSFDYLGKTEPERLNFLGTLLGTSMMSVDFTPFLTGQRVTSTFDLTGLRAEFNKHPECALQ